MGFALLLLSLAFLAFVRFFWLFCIFLFGRDYGGFCLVLGLIDKSLLIILLNQWLWLFDGLSSVGLV
jgi:hypothetical protein